MQIKEIQPEGEDRFWNSLATEVQSIRSGGDLPRIVLFVYGFNVSFTEAALAAARLVTSMQMTLLPVFYSWPSQGQILGYWHDEDMMIPSSLRFSAFLQKLASVPDVEVVIVAHNMGIVTRSLADLVRRGDPLRNLRKVVLAADDLPRAEFTEQWASLMTLGNVQWTLCGTSSDFALRVSTFVHHLRRVGETPGGVFIQRRTDAIDASSTTSVLKTFGHSYVIASPAIAADMAGW